MQERQSRRDKQTDSHCQRSGKGKWLAYQKDYLATDYRSAGSNLKATACLLSAALFMITGMAAGKALAVELKETTGVQVKWVSDSLAKHLLSIENVKDTVKITSDGQYRKAGEDSLSFVLKPGEKLESSDHHSQFSAVFLGNSGKSVRFSYDMKFDSRAFGKNQISVDRGEVTLETRPAAAASPSSESSAQKSKKAKKSAQN